MPYNHLGGAFKWQVRSAGGHQDGDPMGRQCCTRNARFVNQKKGQNGRKAGQGNHRCGKLGGPDPVANARLFAA